MITKFSACTYAARLYRISCKPPLLNDLILSRPFFSFRKDIGDSIARNRFGEVRSRERNIISRKCLYLYGIESRKKTKNSRFSQTYRAIDQISPLFDFIKNKFVLHICLRHAIVFSNINTLSPTIRSTSDRFRFDRFRLRPNSYRTWLSLWC